MPKFKLKTSNPNAPDLVDAEQITLNLIPCWEGGFVSRNNPLGLCVMRRPKWWSLSRIPMVKTNAGWEAVEPYEWVARYPSGEVLIFSDWLFSSSFVPA